MKDCQPHRPWKRSQHGGTKYFVSLNPQIVVNGVSQLMPSPKVVYTAATALIPARIYAPIRGDVSLSAVSEGWDHSLHILSSLSALSPSAKRCLAALQLFNDEIAIEETNITISLLNQGDNAVDTSTKSLVHQRPEGMEDNLVQRMVQPLSDFMDIPTNQEEGLGVLHGMQDFTWLDSLPVDLATAEYLDLLVFGTSA